jgi:hypothetical protein
MNKRRAIAAAFGTVLMAAGTSAGTAHALLDTNTTGSVANTQTASGGSDGRAAVDPTITVTAGNVANTSIIAHSPTNGAKMRNKFTAANGNANGNNRAGNRSGSQRFHIG